MATEKSFIKQFFVVLPDIGRAPVRDHLLHGYETRRDFEDALWRLVNLWKGRVGECVEERHGFLRLRFHDTPGGKPDEEWLPMYLLDPAEMPEYMKSGGEPSDEEKALDEAFGFD